MWVRSFCATYPSLLQRAAWAKQNRGEWAEAKAKLVDVLKLKPEDGPIKALLAVIEAQGPDAPADWKGYRELTEK